MPIKKQKKGNLDENSAVLHIFCDFSCRYAEFGQYDIIGACRKELAVWCKKYKKYNNKNNKCFDGS